MTYSIVAFDAPTSQWGVAVASKAMCVGAHVPWGAGGIGAVATQAYHDLRYGFEGLQALRAGRRADEVVAELTTDDPESMYRQLGVVDVDGVASTFTGSDCMTWAGGLAGDSWCVQGNLLAGPFVVEAMAEAYAGAVGIVRRTAAGRAARRRRRRRRPSRSTVGAVKVWAPPVVTDGDRRDVTMFLRVDDAELPVHDLQRLVAKVIAAPERLIGAATEPRPRRRSRKSSCDSQPFHPQVPRSPSSSTRTARLVSSSPATLRRCSRSPTGGSGPTPRPSESTSTPSRCSRSSRDRRRSSASDSTTAATSRRWAAKRRPTRRCSPSTGAR